MPAGANSDPVVVALLLLDIGDNAAAEGALASAPDDLIHLAAELLDAAANFLGVAEGLPSTAVPSAFSA